MIATSIDGSVGGSNQLLDLLAVVANPESYAEKVKRLEEATAENKKYVELVAPASDILELRERARDALTAAEEQLVAAKAEADGIVKDARAEAKGIRDKAKAEAKALKDQADAQLAAIAGDRENVLAAEREAKSAAAEAKRNATNHKKLADAAKAESAAAAAALEEAVALKADIIAKHKAFIESL